MCIKDSTSEASSCTPVSQSPKLYNVIFVVAGELKVSVAYALNEFVLWQDLIESYKPNPVNVLTCTPVFEGRR